MDVGRPPHDGVVDQLLGPHERPRLFGLAHPRRIFLGRSLALADERDRRAGPIDRADVAVEERLHAQLVQEVVGHLAEMVRRQHLLVVGHRLVAGIDICQQRDEIRQQQEPQPEEIDRDRQDQDQPQHAGKEDDAVPDAESKVVEFLGVVLHPVGRPGPEQVDEHDRHELEEIQVHPRAARHVRDLSQDGERRGSAAEWPAAQPRSERRMTGTPGTGDTLLTFLAAMRLVRATRSCRITECLAPAA